MDEEQVTLDDDVILHLDIQKQVTEEQQEFYKMLENKVVMSFNFAGGLNLVLSCALSYALKYLWNMINLFQFLVFVEKW